MGQRRRPASVPQTCFSPSPAISANGTSPDPCAHTAGRHPASSPPLALTQPSGSPVCSNWKYTPSRLHVRPLLWSKQPPLPGLSPSVAWLRCLSTGHGDHTRLYKEGVSKGRTRGDQDQVCWVRTVRGRRSLGKAGDKAWSPRRDGPEHTERQREPEGSGKRAPHTQAQPTPRAPSGRLRNPYLSPPSGRCLLSSCSNSSEASTIPLSVWLSCAENSEAVPPAGGPAGTCTAANLTPIS